MFPSSSHWSRAEPSSPTAKSPQQADIPKAFPSPEKSYCVGKGQASQRFCGWFLLYCSCPSVWGHFFVDDMHLPSRASHICAYHVAVVCISLLGVEPAAASLPLDSVGDRTVRTGFHFCLLLSWATRSALVRECCCFGTFSDHSNSIFTLVISH